MWWVALERTLVAAEIADWYKHQNKANLYVNGANPGKYTTVNKPHTTINKFNEFDCIQQLNQIS